MLELGKTTAGGETTHISLSLSSFPARELSEAQVSKHLKLLAYFGPHILVARMNTLQAWLTAALVEDGRDRA